MRQCSAEFFRIPRLKGLSREREKMNAAVFGSESDGIVTIPCDRHDEGRNEDSGPSDRVVDAETTDFVGEDDVYADRTSITGIPIVEKTY